MKLDGNSPSNVRITFLDNGMGLVRELLFRKIVHNTSGVPAIQFNPFVVKAQQLTLRKWEEYQASLVQRRQKKRGPSAAAETLLEG